jgi:hypothetical protein
VFDRPAEELPAQAPAACSTVQHWPSLAGRLFDLGMLELLHPSSTPSIGGKPAAAELFGVPKKGSELRRVILDRRRRNAMEKPLDRVLTELAVRGELDEDTLHHLLRLSVLPHPVQFADLVLAQGQQLLISTEDVAEFYHSLEWPRCRWHENAVGGLLRPADLLPFVMRPDRRAALWADVRGGGNGWRQPCLTSPGMGDQKSSAVAQAFHQHLLLSSGAMRLDTWMSYGFPPPPGRLWVGAYIDDVLVARIVDDAAQDSMTGDDLVALSRLRLAHETAGTHPTASWQEDVAQPGHCCMGSSDRWQSWTGACRSGCGA